MSYNRRVNQERKRIRSKRVNQAHKSQENLKLWLESLNFVVFYERLPVNESETRFLTASRAKPSHLEDFFHWEFFHRVDQMAAQVNAPITVDSGLCPPEEVVEGDIMQHLKTIFENIGTQQLPLPCDWKKPKSYSGPACQDQDQQYRKMHLKHFIDALDHAETVQDPNAAEPIVWKDRDYFRRLQANGDYTTPDVTLWECKDYNVFLPLYCALSESQTTRFGGSEQNIEVASWIARLFWSPVAVTRRGVQIFVPKPLVPFGSLAKPDLALVMKLEWDLPFAPVCFASETKKHKTNTENAVAQLALAIHPSLSILILYHLHTRRSENEPLPAWLFIYGMVTDELGIKIYAHFPRLHRMGASERWGYASVMLSDIHQHHCTKKPLTRQRFGLVTTLLTMLTHAKFLTEKLREWKPDPKELVKLRQCAKAEQLEPVGDDVPIPPIPDSPIRGFKPSTAVQRETKRVLLEGGLRKRMANSRFVRHGRVMVKGGGEGR